MSRTFFIRGLSSLSLLAMATGVFAQAAATPPSVSAPDREAHSKSRPQEVAPRVRVPNTDALGNKALPPHPDEDDDVLRARALEDAKPSDIPSTVSTPRPRAMMNTLPVDTTLATYAVLNNHQQLILAELVAERAQSSSVQDFAAIVAHDHSELLDRLKQFAPEAAKPGYLTLPLPPVRSAEVTARTATATRVLPSNAIDDAKKATPTVEDVAEAAALELPTNTKLIPKASTGRAIHLIQIEREIAGLNLAANRDMLERVRGVRFDQAYLHQQIAAHIAIKNQFAIYQNHASPSLAAIFAEGQLMADQHLIKAIELSKSLDTVTTSALPTVPKEPTNVRIAK